MARLRVDFFAETLGMSTSMTVLLPEPAAGQIGQANAPDAPLPPVLYLLHGLSDDDTAWTRRTSIERYAAERGLAVVMPQVQQSFYTDEVHGLRYWTFLSEELPRVVDRFFRVSSERADTFVAGLSMGGYGAMKWALRQPQRFAAAATLSGALAVSWPTEGADPDFARLLRRVFGDGPTTGTPEDAIHLVRTADPQDLPALYLACGTEDFLYPANQWFIEEASAAGVPLTVRLGPGDHEWSYWDAQIRDVLDWLPLRP